METPIISNIYEDDDNIDEQISATTNKTNKNDFSLLSVIGKGTFGKILLVKHIGEKKTICDENNKEA